MMYQHATRKRSAWLLAAVVLGLGGLTSSMPDSVANAQQRPAQGRREASRNDNPSASAPVTILDGSSVWRALYSWNAPLVKTQDGIKERRSKSRRAAPADRPDFRFMTLYPPSGWTSIDFDDSTWARRHFFVKYANGEWDHRAGGGSGSPYLRQLSLRGKFTVIDPAKVSQLWLTMGYRGGMVAYLNGKELTRAYLPAGKLPPGRPAEIYPDKAYLKDDGKPWSWWNERAVIGKEAYPLRVRTVEKLAIPANLLSKGTNVLAIEIHAAAYPEAFVKVRPPWSTCGLIELRLQTHNAEGLRPNVVRPKGVQVWNTNTAEQVFDASWGDPHERLRPISMAGPRNGCCSGRVVVSSDQPMKNFRAEMGELVGPGGKRLPPSAVKLWYGRFDRRRGSRWGGAIDDGVIIWGALPRRRDDALVGSAPRDVPLSARKLPRGTPKARVADGLPANLTEGAVQPVWVVAEIPGRAAAGEYRGTLTISIEAQNSIEVPVELNVIDWAAPGPGDYVYWMGMIQSPEAVAAAYNAPLWSDRHYELVGRSLEWIGKLGGKVLYIPLGAESQYGNEQSMVLWARRAEEAPDRKAAGPGQAGGKYTHDFSRVEKYVDLAIEHMGKPHFVVVGVWDSCMHVSVPKPLKRDFTRFSVRNATTGKITNADGPKHGSPESRRFWKPVLTGVRDILAKRGLDERMLLGYPADKLPNKATVEVFHKILPEVGWQTTRHGERGCKYLSAESAKVPVKYHTNVWGGWTNHDPATRRVYGWKNPVDPSLRTWLDRGLFDASPICQFRTACEQSLLADRHGLGQIGADFWPIKGADGKFSGTMVGRFPATSEGNLGIYAGQLLYPGPNGPVPTARYQMMRENIQECEARIFLEKLLTETPLRLPPDLAEKCQDVLDERTRWHRAQSVSAASFISWPYSGWEVRAVRLYEAAAEAAKAIAPR